MPIHDWTRVKAGKFHDFHQGWTIEIRNALNGGLLLPGYTAEANQRLGGFEPDVIAIESRNGYSSGSVAAPPRARQVAKIESETIAYARKADFLSIRRDDDRVVAILEILSPGNKDGQDAIDAFKTEVIHFLRNGVNVVLVDLFPPTRRDPGGIHHLIWDALTEDPFDVQPADKPLTVASYEAHPDITAYVDPVAVGDLLPDAPLFLAPGLYVNLPLEETYQRSWSFTSKTTRDAVAPPVK